MAKTSEIRAMSIEETKKELQKSHDELLNLRFKLATKQLVNHREIPRVKKNIARLNTVLREKELEVK
jgi:large subunit ribosomal protein L29